MNTELTLWRHARLATMDAALSAEPYGLIADGALLTEGDRLHWVGALSGLPSLARARIGAEHDLGGLLVTPGLIDAPYPSRVCRRTRARIRNCGFRGPATSRSPAPVAASARRWRLRARPMRASLLAAATDRARCLMAEGVTTLEVKSGYGLELATEARCLRVARRLGLDLGLTLRTTALGAHALPPEFEGRSDDYIDAVVSWLPVLQAEGLVDAVDVFCDTIGFTLAQTRRVFDAASSARLCR
jgi:imidazolonepropionase